MKYLFTLSLTFGLIILGCNNGALTRSNTETTKLSSDSIDIVEIQTLIRDMLKWSDSKNKIDLLPVLDKDSICIGFDFDKVNLNLEKLKATGFFAAEFIDNYKIIVQTLDKKIKDKIFQPWNVYELPTFNFANDIDPWCLCQDNLSWDNVAIEIVKLDSNKGEIKWNWGKLDSNIDSSWKVFSYPFRVVKVNDGWKISYLQGFDYDESTR
jgi:hypothetical protein